MQRFYMGGDNDIRGFDVRSLSPYGFLLSNVSLPLLNPDGTPVPVDPANPRRGIRTIPVPLRTLIATGGDTNVVTNVEYRIPLFGPVTLAPFYDPEGAPGGAGLEATKQMILERIDQLAPFRRRLVEVPLGRSDTVPP